MQPLKQHWSDKIGIAPLSVLASPDRLVSILEGENAGLHEDAAYIFRKQLEESDIIVITKTDLLYENEKAELINKTKRTHPTSTVMTISALTGEGVDEWLDEVIRRNDSGNKLIEVDYDVYANGEAVLGWLNGTVTLSGETTDWDKFVVALMSDMCARFEKDALPIGHVKAILKNDKNTVTVNFTGGINTVSVRETAGVGNECRLTINARVETSPENLDAIVRATLNDHSSALTCKEVAWKYLMPGYPTPTYRFDKIV
jgi:G3E family GTPase